MGRQLPARHGPLSIGHFRGPWTSDSQSDDWSRISAASADVTLEQFHESRLRVPTSRRGVRRRLPRACLLLFSLSIQISRRAK